MSADRLDLDGLAQAFHSEQGWYPVKDAVQDLVAAVVAEKDAEIERLRERLDLVTCHVCEETIIPGEDVLATDDSWVHEGCMTEGP